MVVGRTTERFFVMPLAHTPMSFHEISGCLLNDPPLDDVAKSSIHALDEPESQKHWDRYVSNDNRHFMLLGDSEWPAVLVAKNPIFYSWHDDWNKNSASGFTGKLDSLDLAPNETVFVFWMRELCARSNWTTFSRNWINFLYEDEGCIVVAENSLTSIVLSNGRSWVGERPDIEA